MNLLLLKALVITPNPKTSEIGDILAIARSEARKREHAQINPKIRSLSFVPELGIYVAVYEASETLNQNTQKKVTA